MTEWWHPSSRVYYMKRTIWTLSSMVIRLGFRTKTVIVVLIDDFHQRLHRRSTSIPVLLDVSEAFDTVNHSIDSWNHWLKWGASTMLQWFHSLLYNRSQKVMLRHPGHYRMGHLRDLSFPLCFCSVDDTQLYLFLPWWSSGNPGTFSGCHFGTGCKLISWN